MVPWLQVQYSICCTRVLVFSYGAKLMLLTGAKVGSSCCETSCGTLQQAGIHVQDAASLAFSRPDEVSTFCKQ